MHGERSGVVSHERVRKSFVALSTPASGAGQKIGSSIFFKLEGDRTLRRIAD
jgi:hypothetical protein